MMKDTSMPTKASIGCSLDPDYTVMFRKGERVRKVSGYSFPGIVDAAIEKQDGRIVYAVESLSPDTKGMLHIFGHQQLESAE